MRAMVTTTHTQARGQGQRSFGSNFRDETDGQTDDGDVSTSRTNAINKYVKYD